MTSCGDIFDVDLVADVQLCGSEVKRYELSGTAVCVDDRDGVIVDRVQGLSIRGTCTHDEADARLSACRRV
jgi:hypothetical protein